MHRLAHPCLCRHRDPPFRPDPLASLLLLRCLKIASTHPCTGCCRPLLRRCKTVLREGKGVGGRRSSRTRVGRRIEAGGTASAAAPASHEGFVSAGNPPYPFFDPLSERDCYSGTALHWDMPSCRGRCERRDLPDPSRRLSESPRSPRVSPPSRPNRLTPSFVAPNETISTPASTSCPRCSSCCPPGRGEGHRAPWRKMSVTSKAKMQ